MRPSKSRIIDNWFVLEIGWETNATGLVVLDDRACLADGSSISGYLTSSSGKVSAFKKTVLDGSNRGSENLVAKRLITRDASAILSVWSSAMFQGWRAGSWAKLIEGRTAGTSYTSSKEHAKMGRKGGGWVDNLIPRAEQISVTNTSREWGL